MNCDSEKCGDYAIPCWVLLPRSGEPIMPISLWQGRDSNPQTWVFNNSKGCRLSPLRYQISWMCYIFNYVKFRWIFNRSSLVMKLTRPAQPPSSPNSRPPSGRKQSPRSYLLHQLRWAAPLWICYISNYFYIWIFNQLSRYFQKKPISWCMDGEFLNGIPLSIYECEHLHHYLHKTK